MSITLETRKDITKIADELENCKSVLQLETYYKNNFANKAVSKNDTSILRMMLEERYKKLNGEKSSWISGPRKTSLDTHEKRSQE